MRLVLPNIFVIANGSWGKAKSYKSALEKAKGEHPDLKKFKVLAVRKSFDPDSRIEEHGTQIALMSNPSMTEIVEEKDWK